MHLDQQNPYETPASTSDARYPPFRPSPIDTWFCWVLRGCDVQFGRAKKSQTLVLRGHVFFAAFLWLITIGGPTLSVVAVLFNTHPQPDWRGPWSISAACLILGVVGLYARERVVITPESIQKSGPFMHTQCIAWADIVSVKFAKRGAMRLVSASGSYIRIPPDLVGLAEFVNLLEHFLPPSALEDCKENLHFYRKFIGTGKYNS